ncbi:MAG: hypothetical protein KDC54_11255 [Lewinella sp.]|nr:hypothetical protein [Lewinella sp.]
MDKTTMDRLKGTLIVPLGLAIILVPFSMLIGWNVMTLLLFWLVLTPGLAIYLPTIVSNQPHHLFESSVGLVIFYALMVFMIHEHYQTDYFRVMMLSGLINLVLVVVLAWVKKTRAQAH